MRSGTPEVGFFGFFHVGKEACGFGHKKLYPSVLKRRGIFLLTSQIGMRFICARIFFLTLRKQIPRNGQQHTHTKKEPRWDEKAKHRAIHLTLTSTVQVTKLKAIEKSWLQIAIQHCTFHAQDDSMVTDTTSTKKSLF
jgi:hypothetical protein